MNPMVSRIGQTMLGLLLIIAGVAFAGVRIKQGCGGLGTGELVFFGALIGFGGFLISKTLATEFLKSVGEAVRGIPKSPPPSDGL